jgi:antitoxin component of MazEF toxin-antitoxin module
MFDTVVDKKEDQLVLTVSLEMREQLNLHEGDQLRIDVVPSDAEVPRNRRGRFSPGQLLREHAEIMHELENDRAWIDTKPVGRERL